VIFSIHPLPLDCPFHVCKLEYPILTSTIYRACDGNTGLKFCQVYRLPWANCWKGAGVTILHPKVSESTIFGVAPGIPDKNSSPLAHCARPTGIGQQIGETVSPTLPSKSLGFKKRFLLPFGCNLYLTRNHLFRIFCLLEGRFCNGDLLSRFWKPCQREDRRHEHLKQLEKFVKDWCRFQQHLSDINE